MSETEHRTETPGQYLLPIDKSIAIGFVIGIARGIASGIAIPIARGIAIHIARGIVIRTYCNRYWQ